MPLPAALVGLAVPSIFLGVTGLVTYFFPPPKGRVIEVECDIFKGRWVFDAHHYPLYTPQTCPFISRKFDCQNNGRPDNDYMKYKWKPNSCRLPRY